MLTFYKKAAGLLLALSLLSAASIYYCIYHCGDTTALLPAQKSAIAWRALVSSDRDHGGKSEYTLNSADTSIHYQFKLDPDLEFPYVSFAVRFVEQEADQYQHIDLSQFHTLKFNVQCQPANVMMMTIYSFDPGVSALDDLLTYRIPSVYFDCGPKWREVSIDLTALETPEWWLRRHANLASRDYSLAQTAAITFGNSVQSPKATPLQMAVTDLALEQRNWGALLGLIALLLISWILGILWLMREYGRALTDQLKARLQKDLPLMSYQQLSIESHKDKERGALLKYLMTEYHNPDLDLETVSQAVGMNKSKINDILKNEIGMTFIAYLNKLRLTEAARLLGQSHDLNIAEAAFSVGYNNASYFNRLFKSEYGCTPKAFRALMQNTEQTGGEANATDKRAAPVTEGSD